MDWASVAAAGVSAGAQVSQGLLNHLWVGKTNKENWARQDRLNQQNLEMYHYDNEYNSPAAQIARMRAAGLNPGLMYGGSGSVATSTAPPDMHTTNDVAPQISGLPTVSDALSVSAALSQSKLAQAQADYYKSLSQTEDQLRSERLNALILSNANMSKQTEKLVEEIKSYADNHELNQEQIRKLRFDRMMEGKRYLLDSKRLRMDERLTDKQVEKLDADIQKTLAEKNITQREYQEMIWTFAIRKSGLEKQVNLTQEQINSAAATSRKLGYEADVLEGKAFEEQDYVKSLRGDYGKDDQILAYVRSGVRMAVNDVGGIIGVLK